MSLPVVVIVTSQKCGHCVAMRGDGSLRSDEVKIGIKTNGEKKWGWNREFFAALIRGGATEGPARFRVMEVHYLNMNTDIIAEVSFFRLVQGDGVERTTFFSRDGLLYKLVQVNASETIPASVLVPDMTFDQFIRQTVPAQMAAYVFAFPGWIYADGSTWDAALATGSPFFAYVMGLSVIRRPDGRFTFRPPTDMKGLTQDPVQIARVILDGKTISLHEPPPTVKTGSSPTLMDRASHRGDTATCEGGVEICGM